MALGDLLHHGISFGCTTVVFVIYWGLYFTKTELIRPDLVAQENSKGHHVIQTLNLRWIDYCVGKRAFKIR